MSQGITTSKPTVLVAPLDWGLGHATRVIPIIRRLQQQECKVMIAARGRIRALLELEFPGTQMLDLEGYSIQYPNKGWMFSVKIASQVPHILATIKKEHQWLQQAVSAHQIDAVISDNRYGLYHNCIPTVFITHQLQIRTGLGSLADHLLQRLNYQYINRFTECWVPDHAQGSNLAGSLSHPSRLPCVPVRYVGPLTRFSADAGIEKKHLLVVLSGPEPQRTVWEETILHQLKSYKRPVVLVRGLPGSRELPKLPEFIQVFNHLPAQQLAEVISSASFVISRSGYSSVMDLLTMQKKSILVPTPGQAEQEYLGKYLMQENLALCIPQNKFHLTGVLGLANSFPYASIAADSKLDEILTEFIHTVSANIITNNKTDKPDTFYEL